MERTDLLISQAHQFQLGQLRMTFQGSLETKLPGTSETFQARYVSGAARASPKRSGIQFELFCVTLYASISFHSQCFGTHKWICKLHLKDVWGLFKLLCKLVSEFLWASTISFPNKKGAVKWRFWGGGLLTGLFLALQCLHTLVLSSLQAHLGLFIYQ